MPSRDRLRTALRRPAGSSQEDGQNADVLLHDLCVPAGLGTGRPRSQGIELYGGGARLPDKHLDDAGRKLGFRHEHVAPLRIAHGLGKARHVGRRGLGVRLRLQDEGDLKARVVEQPGQGVVLEHEVHAMAKRPELRKLPAEGFETLCGPGSPRQQDFGMRRNEPGKALGAGSGHDGGLHGAGKAVGVAGAVFMVMVVTVPMAVMLVFTLMPVSMVIVFMPMVMIIVLMLMFVLMLVPMVIVIVLVFMLHVVMAVVPVRLMPSLFAGHDGIQFKPGHAGPKLQNGQTGKLSGHVRQEGLKALADSDKDAGRADLHQVPRSEHVVVGAAGLSLDE